MTRRRSRRLFVAAAVVGIAAAGGVLGWFLSILFAAVAEVLKESR